MTYKAPGQADSFDFPLDSAERESAALAVAGTTAPVASVIADYGDGVEDSSETQHVLSWEHSEIDEPYIHAVRDNLTTREE